MEKKIKNNFDVFLGVSRFVDIENNKSKINNDFDNYLQYKLMRVDATKILINDKSDFTESIVLFQKEINESNFLQKNDIVVKLMFPLKFVFIDIDLKENKYLIPSQYCILRANNSKVNPKEVWAYLNNGELLKKIISKKEGNQLMNFVKTSYIKEIDLDASKLSSKKAQLFYKLTKLEDLLNKKKKIIDSYKKFIKY